MKKVYESPKMVAEVFKASQAVAGNCKPGVKEEDAKSVTATCNIRGSLTHPHISDNLTTQIFAKSSNGCEDTVTAANLNTDNTISIQAVYLWVNHNYVYSNNVDGVSPYYFNS